MTASLSARLMIRLMRMQGVMALLLIVVVSDAAKYDVDDDTAEDNVPPFSSYGTAHLACSLRSTPCGSAFCGAPHTTLEALSHNTRVSYRGWRKEGVGEHRRKQDVSNSACHDCSQSNGDQQALARTPRTCTPTCPLSPGRAVPRCRRQRRSRCCREGFSFGKEVLQSGHVFFG